MLMNTPPAPDQTRIPLLLVLPRDPFPRKDDIYEPSKVFHHFCPSTSSIHLIFNRVCRTGKESLDNGIWITLPGMIVRGGKNNAGRECLLLIS